MVPPSIDTLRQQQFNSTLTFEKNLAAGLGFRAYLVSYQSSGLKVFAMVAVPDSAKPANGFPVLVANHGTHPNPSSYGITPGGVDLRPGDYYRAIPKIYARHGFMVVMPDYRGHNVSEGAEYTGGPFAASYYAMDVLALLAGLASLEEADPSQVFMWGHSLGGAVTLRALLAGGVVNGASLWSPITGNIWARAYYYSAYRDESENPDTLDRPKEAIDDLQRILTALGDGFDWRGHEPLLNLGSLNTPILIHHATGDGSVPFHWSQQLATCMYLKRLPYTFYRYESSEHLFSGDDQALAVARDVRFFRGLMAEFEPRALLQPTGLPAPSCH